MTTFQHRLIPAFAVVAFAVIFCCVIAADHSSADEANANVEADIVYEISDYDDHAFVLDCLNKDTATTATIASTYSGVPVTNIGSGAFFKCSSLKSIDIPNSVTTIGEYAFNECVSLTSVNIPNSVTTIGDRTFYYCISLTSVNIPNSVTTIGYKTFSLCASLTSVNIPNSVTTIGNSAFSECKSLTSVNIPNSVTTIGNSAFSECKSLTSVNIPNSVTTIGKLAFTNCTSLTSITIPNSVTTIDDYAFSKCASLTSVNIPSSVTKIGKDAFNCPNLKRIITTLSFKPGDCGSPSNVSILNPEKDEVPKSSTIVFSAGKGIGSAPSVTADYGSTTYLPTSGFTREGYTFAAWATTIDGTTVHYPIGSVYTFRDNDGSTRTFTAHYVANYGTIIFDANGGTATDMSAIAAAMASDGYVHFPSGASFYRSGHILIGWTSATGSNVVYPMDYFFPITDATPTIVMKAVWVPDSTTLYTVNFQPNSVQYTNATGTPFICKVPTETVVATPTTGFVLSGYTLSGWNVQSDGKGSVFGLGEGIKITSDLVLYAQYSKDHDTLTTSEAAKCTIIFNSNGGHFHTPSMTVTKGWSVVKPLDPYYPQHAFLGWMISGTTSYYDWSQPVTSDLVLIAQWEKMFDATVTGATVTITPVGNYTLGVYVDWGDGSDVEIATIPGLSHKFASYSSGTITVYNNESTSTYDYSVGGGKLIPDKKDLIPNDDSLWSFIVDHWVIVLILAIIALVVIVRII